MEIPFPHSKIRELHEMVGSNYQSADYLEREKKERRDICCN